MVLRQVYVEKRSTNYIGTGKVIDTLFFVPVKSYLYYCTRWTSEFQRTMISKKKINKERENMRERKREREVEGYRAKESGNGMEGNFSPSHSSD